MWAAFSKYGKLKLGKDNEKPEYSLISWFTMLFSAGMGIGLIFWGVAEPLNHYIHPFNLQGFTQEAKTFAMTKSFLHWGISAWSCYAILALALTYFQFRKGKPALMSSLLIPLIGEKKSFRMDWKCNRYFYHICNCSRSNYFSRTWCTSD